PAPGAELAVAVDGQALPSASATLPRKVNPGRHRVAASAPGFAEQSRDVDVEEGKETAVTVALTATPGAAPMAGAPPSAVPAEGAPATTSPAPDTGVKTEKSTLAYVGLGIGAVGVAGLVVGTVFGLKASSKWNDAKALCNPYPSNCGTEGSSLGKD